MSSILDKQLSILERKPISHRMRERDEAGKQYKKTKKIPIKNDWDKVLWE